MDLVSDPGVAFLPSRAPGNVLKEGFSLLSLVGGEGECPQAVARTSLGLSPEGGNPQVPPVQTQPYTLYY